MIWLGIVLLLPPCWFLLVISQLTWLMFRYYQEKPHTLIDGLSDYDRQIIAEQMDRSILALPIKAFFWCTEVLPRLAHVRATYRLIRRRRKSA